MSGEIPFSSRAFRIWIETGIICCRWSFRRLCDCCFASNSWSNWLDVEDMKIFIDFFYKMLGNNFHRILWKLAINCCAKLELKWIFRLFISWMFMPSNSRFIDQWIILLTSHQFTGYKQQVNFNFLIQDNCFSVP